MSEHRPTQEHWAAVEAAMKHEAEDGWKALVQRHLHQHPEKAKRLEGLPLKTEIKLVETWIGGSGFASGVDSSDAKWAGY